MAGKMRNACPRKNQKAAVVDHQRQIAFAHLVAPADELVACRHAPGSAGEQQGGQWRQIRLAPHAPNSATARHRERDIRGNGAPGYTAGTGGAVRYPRSVPGEWAGIHAAVPISRPAVASMSRASPAARAGASAGAPATRAAIRAAAAPVETGNTRGFSNRRWDAATRAVRRESLPAQLRSDSRTHA